MTKKISKEVTKTTLEALAEAIKAPVSEPLVTGNRPPRVAKDLEVFGARPSSKRERALEALLNNAGKNVPAADLAFMLYGKQDQAAKLALGRVCDGVLWMITKGALPYVIEKEITEGESFYKLSRIRSA